MASDASKLEARLTAARNDPSVSKTQITAMEKQLAIMKKTLDLDLYKACGL
jgi:hypothetical protein